MKRFLGILVLLVLTACSKVTAENYKKMSVGMSRAEVVALLGEPSSTERSSFLALEGEAAVWQNGKIQIEGQFLNQKLLAHTMVE